MVVQTSQPADVPSPRSPRPGRIRLSQYIDNQGPRILGISHGLLMAIFLASLMIPASVPLGPLRITPYTGLLIIFFVPLILTFIRDKTNRIIALDYFMAAHVFWIGIAVLHAHGLERLVFVINTAISQLGGYMIGRILIRRTRDYETFFHWFFIGLMIWLPFSMLELATGRTPIRDILRIFLEVDPRPNNSRMGLNRVQAFAEHPITYGLFCSIGVANIWYIYRDRWVQRLGRTGLTVFATVLSLSSAPTMSVVLQFGLIGWNMLLRGLRYKWVMLVVVGGAILLVIQLAAPNGIVGLVIDNLSYDPVTGWARTEIFNYGSAEALRHPFFGIGFGEWVRPFWRGPSVDNFWLLMAMRYGFPALLFLWVGLIIHAANIMSRPGLSEELSDYRSGYLFAWVGMIFVLGTVHIWGSTAIFIMTYIGAGAWLYTGSQTETPPPPRRVRDMGAAGAADRASGKITTRPSQGGRALRPARKS